MGKHKDEHGKTRVGVFLKGLGEVADPLLKVAADLTGVEALDALSDAMDIIEPERLLEYLNPNTLKMLKDSEDRGFGAPVQPIISPDSSMRPTVIKLVARDFPNT